MLKHYPKLKKIFKKAQKVNFDKRYRATKEWEKAFAKFIQEHPNFKDRSKFV